MQAKSEIEKFIQIKAPDDNQLFAAYKQASKKADKLQSELQAACNALESMTIEHDDCFGEDFLSSLMEFSLEIARNNNAQENYLPLNQFRELQIDRFFFLPDILYRHCRNRNQNS